MWNPYQTLTSSRQNILGVASFLILIVLWGCLSLVIDNPSKLPSPWATATALGRMCCDGKGTLFLSSVWASTMAYAAFWSISRIVLAGAIVFIVGVPVGILMGASPVVNAVLSPLVDPFRSAPVASLLSVLVMWLGIGESMKITFLFIGAVVYLIPMVRDAIKAVPQTYWISAYDLGATPFEAVMKAVVPMAKPRIADAFVAAVSIEWTYITVAEYVNAESGLGQIISNAKRISAMDRIFATILVIILLALLTYRLMTAIKHKLYPWESE
jgi:ABC-type nitrate/sulfonate/bicarbonate transport system permease component